MKLTRLVVCGTLLWIVVVAAVFHYFLWLQTDQPYHLWAFINQAQNAQFFDAARTTATLLGVVGLGGAALIAYRRQSSTEAELVDERTKALHERYTTAAEQLGNESPAIRLAGIYALTALADDWFSNQNVRQQQVCIDLLCAYLRADAHSAAPQERDVRKAIVSCIRDRTQYVDGRYPSGGPEWHLRSLDLSGVNLTGGSLSGSRLSSARLTHANLAEATLTGVTLSEELFRSDKFNEDLEDSMRHKMALPPPRPLQNVLSARMIGTSFDGASMGDARLDGCDPLETTFKRALLVGATFRQAALDTCDFTGAFMYGAYLVGAKMSTPRAPDPLTRTDAATSAHGDAAKFVRANLTNATLRYASLAYADFTGALLKGADLTGATGLDKALLDGIVYDESTKWPDGFSPPSANATPRAST